MEIIFILLWLLLGWWVASSMITLGVLLYAKIGIKSVLLLLPMVFSFAWIVIPFFTVVSFMLNRTLKKYEGN